MVLGQFLPLLALPTLLLLPSLWIRVLPPLKLLVLMVLLETKIHHKVEHSTALCVVNRGIDRPIATRTWVIIGTRHFSLKNLRSIVTLKMLQSLILRGNVAIGEVSDEEEGLALMLKRLFSHQN